MGGGPGGAPWGVAFGEKAGTGVPFLASGIQPYPGAGSTKSP